MALRDDANWLDIKLEGMRASPSDLRQLHLMFSSGRDMNCATNKRGVVTTYDVGAFEKNAQDLLAVQIFADEFEF